MGLGHGVGVVHGLGHGHGHVHISTHISNPLEEEEKLNTHLTSKATFLYCTYTLFFVSLTSPLYGHREREVGLGENIRRWGGREKEG